MEHLRKGEMGDGPLVTLQYIKKIISIPIYLGRVLHSQDFLQKLYYNFEKKILLVTALFYNIG